VSDAAARYVPGRHVAISTAALWGLIDLPLDDGRVEDLWSAADRGADEVVDVLLRTGLRSLPGFAVVERGDDGLRCLVRAPARVRFGTGPETLEEITPGTAVWSDSELPSDATYVRLALTDDGAGPSLPTAGGINPASCLTVELEPAVRHDDAASPAPEVPETPRHAGRAADLPDALELDDEPAPADAPGAATGDHTAEYYQLLVSSTSDLAALRERLVDDDRARPETPAHSAAEPMPSELGATGVWRDPAEGELPGSTESVTADHAPTTDPIESTSSAVIDGLPWAAHAHPPSPAPPVATPVESHTPLPRPPARVVPPSAPRTTPGDPGAGTGAEVDATAVTTSRAALLRQLAEEHIAGPTVLAVHCAHGHLSPPYAGSCRVCGAQLPDQTPVEVPRPRLGRLALSTGTTVVLDKGVILGRAPHSDVEDAAERPNLVRLVESGEISRMHTSVSIEGWQVLLRDLGSQNGTFLTVPGAEAQQLRSHEDYELEPGSLVSLADVVTFTFEVSE
jgi:hypothetical protein